MRHLCHLLIILLLGCSACINSSEGNSRENAVQTDGGGNVQPVAVKQDIMRYRPLNFDTTVFEKDLSMYNKPYHLKISAYSLNDSGVAIKMNDSTVVIHNTASRIILTQGGRPVIDKIITKTDFKDSISNYTYRISTLRDVTYEAVRTNRLYFNCWLSNEAGKHEMKFAIFYQGPHKGRLDFWKGLILNY